MKYMRMGHIALRTQVGCHRDSTSLRIMTTAVLRDVPCGSMKNEWKSEEARKRKSSEPEKSAQA
jgi:hypothetical protein